MVSNEQRQVAVEARAYYEERLREELERSHLHDFVAIEPVSGDFFTGPTLSDAIGAPRAKHPHQLVHTMRVGHRAAIHLGMQIR